MGGCCSGPVQQTGGVAHVEVLERYDDQEADRAEAYLPPMPSLPSLPSFPKRPSLSGVAWERAAKSESPHVATPKMKEEGSQTMERSVESPEAPLSGPGPPPMGISRQFSNQFIELALDEESPGPTLRTESLTFNVQSMNNLYVPSYTPAGKLPGVGVATRLFVRITIHDKEGRLRYAPLHSKLVQASKKRTVLNLRVELHNICDTDIIKFSLCTSILKSEVKSKLGQTVLSVADLRQRDEWPELWLFHKSAAPVFNQDKTAPTTLALTHVSFQNAQIGLASTQNSDKATRREASDTFCDVPKELIDVDSDTDNIVIEGFEPEDTKLLESSNSILKMREFGLLQSNDSLSQESKPSSSSGPDQDQTSSCEQTDDEVHRPHLERTDPIPSSRIMNQKGASNRTIIGEEETRPHLERTDPVPSSQSMGQEEAEKAAAAAAASSATEVPVPVSSVDMTPNVEATLSIRTEVEAGSESLWPKEWEKGVPKKHVMVVTRGTRGDVQPFIALARGLAEILDWDVTICTELRYRSLIRRHMNVRRGSIRFRPSGGDTESRIDKPMAKWAVSTKSRLVHAAILARAEREFFDSEPAFYYWAKKLKPDVLCFTFTTANVTMILSEALKIPCIGFFLQPTVLPSKQYSPIVPLQLENLDSEANHLELKGLESHKVFRYIKNWTENNVFSHRLEDMRKRRGLKPSPPFENDFERLGSSKYQLIVPIKPDAFGGRPDDWPSSFHMTDFIFLRGNAMPQIAPDLQSFIDGAKAKSNRLLCICFSSMPVSRSKILEAALLILEQGPKAYQTSIVALVGDRSVHDQASTKLESRAEEFVQSGRLHIARGAPFSRLFPLMDFIVTHGGLGSTAEALASGKPCLVTGVLLLDQRFWGKRVFELGVGPPSIHISDFTSKILDVLPDALDPNGAMAQRARQVADSMFPGGIQGMSDGVAVNVAQFKACVLTGHKPSSRPSKKPRAVKRGQSDDKAGPVV